MTVSRTDAARRTNLWQMFAVLIGVGMLAGGAIALLEAIGFHLPPAVAGLAALVVGGATMLWSKGWWSRIDEGVREAHKSSWYWGGSVGMIVVGGLAATLLFDRSGVSLDQFAMVPGDGGLILTGIVVTLLLQLVGYGLFWVGWWFSRSR